MSRSACRGAALLFCLFLAFDVHAQAFGGTVALSGDQALVGQVNNTGGPGTVTVYARFADGQWIETQRFTADDPATGDRFGRALAVIDNLAIVGSTATDSNKGAAYVFERGADGAWRQTQKLQPTDFVEGDNFGRAVAIQGDRVLVSSAGRQEQRGVVVSYRRASNGRFQEEGRLSAADLAPESFFGLAVALDSDHALVSAPGHQGGSVFAFRMDESTDAWVEIGRLVPADSVGGANYGAAIAMKGGMAFVGAPTQDGNRGAVHLFSFDDSEWQPSGILLPFDGGQPALGAGLTFVGDELWASAPIAASYAGGVYRFAMDDSDRFTGSTLVTSESSAGGRSFGVSVAGRPGIVVLGAPGDMRGIGSVEIYEGSGHEWRRTALFEGDGPKRMESITGGKMRCEEGKAGAFGCQDYDLLSFVSIDDLGGNRGVNLNDIWGWTDPETGREWALVGRTNGTSFVDVTDPQHPIVAGDLPMTPGSQAASWRDMKVYKDHVFIVADGAGQHGLQVFDLRQLRDVQNPPVQFTANVIYDRIASAHNVVINEESGFAYTVGNSMGGETCGGGYHIVDVRDPQNPTMAGCWGHAGTGNAGTGYSHDAQCVMYRGPDADHRGKEICLGSNETAISIADLTDKANPKPIAVAQYPNVSYTHQGWLTEDHRFFYVDDELDEMSGKTDRTRTLVWDVTDLDEPELVKEFRGNTPAIDHNLYIRGNLMYQSNYAAGLRVIDISDPANPVEVGYFDVNPISDAAEFSGSWSNFPYFKSGTIAVTSIELGLFLVKKQEIDI